MRFVLYFCVALLLAGCSGGHHTNTISVTLSGAPSTVTAGGAAVTITATVANDSSNAGVTWAVTGGGTYTSTTTTLTYTPPPTVPSNPAVTVTATSITDSSATAVASFTIQSGTSTTACQASPALRGNEAALSGVSVAFLVKGADSSDAPIAYAGSVTFSDTAGAIHAGLLDVVGFETGETGEQNVDLTTSAFSYGTDGRGCLYLGFNEDDRATHPMAARGHYMAKGVRRSRPVKFASKSKKPNSKLATAATDEGAVVFSFVLLNPQGGPGRIEEFDNTTGTGTVAAGQLAVQNTDDFSFSSLATTFAFGADGWASNEEGIARVAAAGQIALNKESGDLNGVADENIGGSVNYGAGAGPGPLMGGSGSLSETVDASTGRGSGSYAASNNEGDVTYDFAIYIIDAGDAFIISTDDPTVNGFMLSGRWLETSASSPATLSGYYLNSINGLDCDSCSDTNPGNNYVSVAAFSVLAGVPLGNDYINDGGEFSSNAFNGTYAFSSTYGRTLFTDGAVSNVVGYVTNTGSEDELAAFVIGTDDNAGSGYIFTQASTQPNYTSASLNGSFAFGTAEDVAGIDGSVVGAFKLDGAGNYTATIDQIFVGSAYQPDNNVSGTYSVSPNGLGNFDSNSVAFVTNGSLIVAIDASDTEQPLQYFLFEQVAQSARVTARKSHGHAPAVTNITSESATSGSTGGAFAKHKSN